MADVTVRRANPEDAAMIASVLYDSFAEFRPFYTDRGFAATAVNAAEVLARLREGPAWVALVQDSIRGTVAVFARGDALYIRGMAVLPEGRGQGVGRELLRQVEIFAAAEGHRTLVLTTTPFLNSAIRLYQRSGFSRTATGAGDLFGTPLLTMEKTLGASPV